jgi:uncharacterized membrane protein
MMKKYVTPRSIALFALFSALVTVATLVIRIPIPATKGYFNLGDTLIFLTASLLGPVFGLVCGGVGSALADVIGGYVHFAPWTLVIKGIEGLFAGLLIGWLKPNYEKKGFALFILLVSFIFAALWMVVGYFFAEYIIYAFSFAPALAELPFNLLQGGISAVLAAIITPLLIHALKGRLEV